jgi:hypothetical protein
MRDLGWWLCSILCNSGRTVDSAGVQYGEGTWEIKVGWMCAISCYSGKSVDTTLVQYGKGIVEM